MIFAAAYACVAISLFARTDATAWECATWGPRLVIAAVLLGPVRRAVLRRDGTDAD